MLPDHPLAERNKISVEDLAGFKLIRSIDARGGRSILDQLISDITMSLSTKVFTNSLPLSKRMIIGAGRGSGDIPNLDFSMKSNPNDCAIFRLKWRICNN